MVILSEFQLIYSNKKFARIKIRNFRKNRNYNFAIFATFAICEIAIFVISQITQFDSERGIAISQITQLDFEPILQPWPHNNPSPYRFDSQSEISTFRLKNTSQPYFIFSGGGSNRWSSKVGCVFSMVGVYMLPHAENR